LIKFSVNYIQSQKTPNSLPSYILYNSQQISDITNRQQTLKKYETAYPLISFPTEIVDNISMQLQPSKSQCSTDNRRYTRLLQRVLDHPQSGM